MTRKTNGDHGAERGASIAFALLFLLVASMVAVMILSAALSAMQQTKSAENEQQIYLTTNSAAELVRDSVGYTLITRKGSSAKDYSYTASAGKFASLLKSSYEAIDNKMEASSSTTASDTFTLSITEYGQPVTATIVITKGSDTDSDLDAYSLNGQFLGNGSDGASCQLFLTMTGTIDHPDSSTSSIVWSQASITGREASNA